MSRRDGIYTSYMRMKPEHFDHLLLVKEGLTKKDYCSIKFSVFLKNLMKFHQILIEELTLNPIKLWKIYVVKTSIG